MQHWYRHSASPSHEVKEGRLSLFQEKKVKYEFQYYIIVSRKEFP